VLTARQPRLPAGWNRSITYYVAIHSGSGRGSAVSAGCLHATESDVRYLMRTVPLGTPVQINS
jgi:lipoprotein-anchoring transpeptidase ErfK/SrfK